ncbi:hypothetical protein BDZ89DRAFT_1148094 [Hymenopellis radicata]|nr:hypothetical protein BDZ89DRAFT_1148094 [Hymenopellis radicata]
MPAAIAWNSPEDKSTVKQIVISIPELQEGQLPGHNPDESVFSRWLHEEVFAPEKLPRNISIATGVSVFIDGILAVRTWGHGTRLRQTAATVYFHGPANTPAIKTGLACAKFTNSAASMKEKLEKLEQEKNEMEKDLKMKEDAANKDSKAQVAITA